MKNKIHIYIQIIKISSFCHIWLILQSEFNPDTYIYTYKGFHWQMNNIWSCCIVHLETIFNIYFGKSVEELNNSVKPMPEKGVCGLLVTIP